MVRRHIDENGLLPGTRLPTERDLATRFNVSRPTVTRALNDLVAEGLINRKVGSGSYVAETEQTAATRKFGLLVPGLGRGEIFEPICAKIAERAASDGFTLSWGGSSGQGRFPSDLLRIAQQFVDQNVDGVFYQPLELHPYSEMTNSTVLDFLTDRGVPAVLLDADHVPFPERSRFDIVGIDNVRAGFTAAKHLIDQGTKRVDFVDRPFSAKTGILRKQGYRMALLDHHLNPNSRWEHSVDIENLKSCKHIMSSGARDIVCGCDEIAALLMVQIEKLGVSVPEELRLVGFDDLKYAHLMRVPLTTLHQPCAAIGDLAVDTMLTRLQRREQPGRKVLLEAELVARRSSERPKT